ncbi:D-aminoacyl-tRNA deacylase [Magnetococcales bacterium HHB-1]
MRAVVQRVLSAKVEVDGRSVGEIEQGLLVFLAVEQGDGLTVLEKMAKKIAGMRVFPDVEGRMNRSIKACGGSLLVVSQFTLVADMKKGFRPSFSRAEAPEKAAEMVDIFCEKLRQQDLLVAEGIFAADMKVSLVNDGPVTFALHFTE